MATTDREHGRRDQTLRRTTIFARSTGALPSAIAIVRISGPAAGDALIALTGRSLPEPRQAALRALRHRVDGQLLDRALVIWMPGPKTATGEDIVELHLHGGRAVVAAVEQALAAIEELSPAEPGAFTRRAFENGVLDLTQVEGLANLLAADTERQRVAALALVEGGLRRVMMQWQAKLIELCARCEASVDMSDEGDVGPDPTLGDDIAELAATIEVMVQNPPAERLRDGVRVVLAGPPNAGKSTLINALAGRDAAIVTPIAGTTRDIIEVPLVIGGLPLILSDTAGIRSDSDDTIEIAGIERARAAIDRANIVIWFGADRPSVPNVIHIAAQSDLGVGERNGLPVSAKTGEGLDELRRRIIELADELVGAEGLALTSAQRHDLSEAREALLRACAKEDAVLRADELRFALACFHRISGTADVEAVLDDLFARFCVGK